MQGLCFGRRSGRNQDRLRQTNRLCINGRSDGRRDGNYEPRKLAGTLAEAIRSLAPRVSLVVGSGLGGRTSLALITTPRPTFLPRVALIDTLPGTAVDAQFDDLTLWEELAGLENPAGSPSTRSA